jgi:hypothetical protein
MVYQVDIVEYAPTGPIGPHPIRSERCATSDDGVVSGPAEAREGGREMVMPGDNVTCSDRRSDTRSEADAHSAMLQAGARNPQSGDDPAATERRVR